MRLVYQLAAAGLFLGALASWADAPTRNQTYSLLIAQDLESRVRVATYEKLQFKFAVFYAAFEPANSPLMPDLALYVGPSRERFVGHYVSFAVRTDNKSPWYLVDPLCSPNSLIEEQDDWVRSCIEVSKYSRRNPDEAEVEWVPVIEYDEGIVYALSDLPERPAPYELLSEDASDKHLTSEKSIIASTVERFSKKFARSEFEWDSGFCFAVAHLLREHIEALKIKDLRVRYIHLYVPEARSAEKGLFALFEKDRTQFVGRFFYGPDMSFRFHTALLIEKDAYNFVVDPVVTERFVGAREWKSSLFKSTHKIEYLFLDQPYVYQDTQMFLSKDVAIAKSLSQIQPDKLTLYDWSVARTMGHLPANSLPDYVIMGYNRGGAPRTLRFDKSAF